MSLVPTTFQNTRDKERILKTSRENKTEQNTRNPNANSNPEMRKYSLQDTVRKGFPTRASHQTNHQSSARKSKAKPNGKKPAAEEKKMYLEPEYTKSRITDVGFKELVVLPREIDLNEWLASNTTTFFHHVNLQYSTISEFCTGEACQTMAVCNTQYYWYDERGKKVKCTAPQYVDFVMSSVQKLVTDEDVFPTKYGREFPSSFESLVKKICKYLFHVLAHIYWSHFKETLALELHGHLNTLYVHFILFAREFNLLDSKDTAVMDDLTEVLCSGGGRGGGGGEGASGGGAGAQNHGKER
ncbi:MOB kinase activator 2 isoform X2 [Mirounga leonina]|uniref:MOB kinase activator 2 isoform X2 n=1 Tax=Mirounga leonina TaxID=9715 RepID=UPI00156C221D|nr:MOB kinase activator 2 isoform X2 [Mirounga leonina]